MQRTKRLFRLRDFLPILSGVLLLSVAINVFFLPSDLSAGGVTAIGTVLWHLFGIRVSITNLICNVLLFLIGGRVLGRGAVFRTAIGTLLLSGCLELTARLPIYHGERAVAAVAGGVLMGLGVGLTVRCGASTGGSDFAGLILHRFFSRCPVAVLILAIDCATVLLAGAVFESGTVTLYSTLALLVSSLQTDLVLSIGKPT